MNSHVTENFLACFAAPPDAVKTQARKAFRHWRQDPSHPSLHFKRVHSREPVYSVRVSLGWRVLGLHEGDTMYWFWIGSHADYDRQIKQ
ncbi:MAG: hypothetical protein ACOX1P_23335 [Thermoguttaceae bacterium]